ncbi:hypothetical protein BH11MYX4_BH11MYX4_19840 [soil metagenome]
MAHEKASIRWYDGPAVRVRIMITRLAVTGALLALAGCILLVSPDDYGEHCGFRGQDTTCGTCLATKCRAALDACCRDDGCAPTLSIVERCATGDQAACASAESEESAASPTRIALARCLVDGCQTTCRTGTPTRSITQCSVPAFGRGQACTCVVSASPNDTACNEQAFPNTVCCAPSGWPGASLRCSCRAFDCQPTSDGCLCALTDGASEGTQCGGAICCLDHDVCQCGSRPCLAADQQVPSCDFSKVGCAVGQQRVTSCAAEATR